MNTGTGHVLPAHTPLSIEKGTLDDAVNAAASAVMNALAPELPPLAWALQWFFTRKFQDTAIRGLVQEGSVDDVVAVAEQWADALGLTEDERPLSAGVRSWSGNAITVLGRPHTGVDVWCVVDRAAFEG